MGNLLVMMMSGLPGGMIFALNQSLSNPVINNFVCISCSPLQKKMFSQPLCFHIYIYICKSDCIGDILYAWDIIEDGILIGITFSCIAVS